MIANCLICDKAFNIKPSHQKLGWGKYCSLTCRHKSQLNGKVFKCHICKKETYKSKAKQSHSKSGYFFCSKRCQTLWRNNYYSESKSPNWKGGGSVYRNILRRSKIKPVCALCKIDDETILTAHHKDHNRKNNILKNLTWLCLNCHFLVHHNSKLDKIIKSLKQ